jgi:sigma-B regulation protein RsbU (phosphoserine phosphatase)
MDSPTADLFPLYARARLVGAMLVGPSNNSRPLIGRRLNIVSGIAQQAAIAVVNHQLYKESEDRSRMEQELDVARSIQASLIPDGQPDIPGCTVYSFWEAARQVSGDFYDFLPLADNKWGIAIADVADKGIPAALFMALSRTILRTVAFNRTSPARVLERTNELIYNDTTSDLFVTVFYCLWDPQTATLTYASGGHNPPLLIRRNGSASLLKVSGIALGVLEDITLDQKSVHLESGDTVIFYTDGVTEAMNEDYDEYGMERLRQLATSKRKNSAEEIARAIRESIDDHAGGAPQFDDITLVVLKR